MQSKDYFSLNFIHKRVNLKAVTRIYPAIREQ